MRMIECARLLAFSLQETYECSYKLREMINDQLEWNINTLDQYALETSEVNERERALVARDFGRIFMSIIPHATVGSDESYSGRAGATRRDEVDIDWGDA